MPEKQKKNDDFFDSIAPKVQSPVLITTKNQIKKTSFGRFGGLFLILSLFVLAGFGFLSVKYQEVSGELKQISESKNQSVKKLTNLSLLERLANHIVLPEGQQPSIVTIDDAAGLKNTYPIYTDVKNGDKLITFKEVQLVYDPLADLVVSVRPITSTLSIAGGNSKNTEIVNLNEPINLDIRNGSGKAGLAKLTGDALGSEKSYNVVKIGNAAKGNHATTIIVNLKDVDVRNLEDRLNVTAITSLPPGEPSSNADVVIILGQDNS